MSKKWLLKEIIRPALYFAVTAALLLGILLLSTLVPREVIRPQMQSSAEFLCKGKLFGEVLPGVASSRIDRYADSILLGIAWQFDSQHALRSVMEASYYHLVYQNENENLRDAVERGYPPNQQYLRYWHGSAGVIRMLMAFLTLPRIYTLHAVIISILLLGLMFRLVRRGEMITAAAFLAGMVGISLPFVPLSLEYTWVFLILLIQLHIVLLPAFPRDWPSRCLFFLISGMVTNYLDFLTCETVTLLVPLLFLLQMDHRTGRQTAPWKTLTKTAAYWLIGYGGMFLLKWGLAGLVMGENVLPYVAEHAGERVAGSVGVGFFRERLEILLRNVTCLFPLDHGPVGMAAGILIALAAVYCGCVSFRGGFDKGLAARCTVIALVPYLRFLVMANHSYLHYFFTYRAQCTALIAIILMWDFRRQTVVPGDEVLVPNDNEDRGVPEENDSPVPLTILMPCRNEEAAVGQCVDDARSFLERNGLAGEILVVDNASDDRSAAVASAHGARVVTELNPGYGTAVRKGLACEKGRVIIIGDCDTTYDFDHLENIYEALTSGGYDVVIGDRFAGGIEKGAMSLSHRIGVRLLSALGRAVTGTDVRDFHCGLRGLTREAARKLDFQTSGMEFASEMIVLAAKNDLRIAQVPVPLRRCVKDRRSKLRAIPDGFRHLRYLMRFYTLYGERQRKQ